MKPDLKFLHSLFEVSHVEYQAYDLNNHKLLFSSGLAHKLLGYTTDEYCRFSYDFYKDLVHPDDRDKVHEAIDKILHSPKGEVVEMTIRLLKADGNYIWVYSRQMVFEKDEKGELCTIIRESEDVTNFIRMQDELREKVQQLQTISYKNSHLLRSPVSSIIGLISLVEAQGITSEHNMQIFNYLKQAIEKLDNVIHEINEIAEPDI
ncbi:MAG: domain S-box protein [Mucilaginibacter sp.]|jgi:PAS domain S-box-containing protein|nr:domain S-box protein [Mucilaginibacter sp.]MDB5138887.1 domain S-box protein [Mucilaginibacter sp.]